MNLQRAFALALGVLVAACSAPPESRYPQATDAAPVRGISADQVKDAVPRADPILAAGNLSPYTVNGVRYEILEDASSHTQRGIA